MNKVVLLGRLTRDPEVRYSQTNTSMAIVKYGLAVRRTFVRPGDPEADFFNITAFGKTGEFAEKYFRKGQLVCVSGRVQTRIWEDENKIKHNYVDIIVDDQSFAESKDSFNSRGSHNDNYNPGNQNNYGNQGYGNQGYGNYGNQNGYSNQGNYGNQNNYANQGNYGSPNNSYANPDNYGSPNNGYANPDNYDSPNNGYSNPGNFGAPNSSNNPNPTGPGYDQAALENSYNVQPEVIPDVVPPTDKQKDMGGFKPTTSISEEEDLPF